MSPGDLLEYDVVVIGTGPGGEGAAMQVVKGGGKVLVVERYSKVGGACTHWSTIPSKALRHAILEMTHIRNNPISRENHIIPSFEFPHLRRSAKGVIEKQVNMRTGFYERNRVQVLNGIAKFVEANMIEVEEPDGAKKKIAFKHCVIAVGARPYRPADIDFTHKRVFDTDTILDLDYTPQSITVYGAGVTGCEYTSMFRNLDCKVNLVNTREKLLEFLDDEITDALSYHMRERGVLLRHGESYQKVETKDDEVVLHLKSGKLIRGDIFLWANGRAGNSNNLGLETLAIEIDARGSIKVNENFQTNLPHIYAVGDVIGFPALASAAYHQGRFAATHILTGEGDFALVRDIPTGIYTDPEISSIGRTEKELTAAKVPYEIGHAQFRSLARAQITGQTTGMLKLLFHRETLQILGIHCFGANASEIIHIGQAIMTQEGSANSLLYFIKTTFNYPTMAEAYRVAALNGYNRVA